MVMEPVFGNVFRGRTILVTGDMGFKWAWLATWVEPTCVIGHSLPPKTAKDNFALCGLNTKTTHTGGDTVQALKKTSDSLI